MHSQPSGGLKMQVSMKETEGILASSTPIGYGWFTTTNQSLIVYLLKDEYLCTAKMFDSASNAVTLRNSFRDFGNHFFDLKYPSGEQTWDTIDGFTRIKPAHGTQSEAAETLFAGPNSTEGRFLPCPDDLFQLKSLGRYTLRLQFQVYERIYKGGRNFAYKLERFDPIEFTVTKE
jgi:hypothetical protein